MSDAMTDMRNNKKLRDEIESLRQQLASRDAEVAALKVKVAEAESSERLAHTLFANRLIECDQLREQVAMLWEELNVFRDEPEPYADPDANKTPAQLRAEGRAYCPKCYTFGDSHRKDCPYKDQGMGNHTKVALAATEQK